MIKKNISYIGLDIGGANLKVVGLNRNKKIIFVEQFKCPIWRGTDVLVDKFKIFKNLNPEALMGITMTGELCDNFLNREDGVKKIIGCTQKIKCLKYFFTNNKDRFKKKPSHKQVASMNWLATAEFISKKITNGLIVDFGSTTIDLILIKNKKCANIFFDDFNRINNSELIYTGCTRTPIFGITNQVILKKKIYNIIPEFFSNTADLYRAIKILPDDLDLYESADGKNKSRTNSLRRVARNFGLDYNTGNKSLILKLCKKLISIQLNNLHLIINKIFSKNNFFNKTTPIILCGIGKSIIKLGKQKYNFVNFEDLLYVNSKKNTCASYHAPATSCALLISELK